MTLLRIGTLRRDLARAAVRLIINVMVLAIASSTPGIAHFFLVGAWRRFVREGQRTSLSLDWSLQFLRDLKGVEISCTLSVCRTRPSAVDGKGDPRFYAWLAELQRYYCFSRGCERRLIYDPKQVSARLFLELIRGILLPTPTRAVRMPTGSSPSRSRWLEVPSI